jgi:hypothetical protein
MLTACIFRCRKDRLNYLSLKKKTFSTRHHIAKRINRKKAQKYRMKHRFHKTNTKTADIFEDLPSARGCHVNI